MKFGGAGEKARAAIERVVAARGGEIPYAAMAELIELGADEGVRRGLVAEMQKQLRNAERAMALAWLCLVAGEVGRDGLRAVIELLGQTESDDVAEAAIATLTRHVLEAYEDIKRAIDASSVPDQRCSLYEALAGAAVLGDAKLKRDLGEYARLRVERELELPASSREALGPLRLLVYSDAPDARERFADVRARTRSETSRANLDELESHLLGGSEDPLELTRAILKDGWRDTAEHLRKLFHPTKDEERQLRELMASLGPGGRRVH